MHCQRIVTRAVIRRKSIKVTVMLASSCAFMIGTAAGAVAVRIHTKPAPTQPKKEPAPIVRATFELVDPFEGKGSVRVDRTSFCRQVATEALLSMRPEFSSQSIKISRNPERKGEVIEQFAETLGSAIERVWSCDDPQDEPLTGTEHAER